jgi:hypothetical protein
MGIKTNGSIRRLAKPSARGLFDNKHVSTNIDIGLGVTS